MKGESESDFSDEYQPSKLCKGIWIAIWVGIAATALIILFKTKSIGAATACGLLFVNLFLPDITYFVLRRLSIEAADDEISIAIHLNATLVSSIFAFLWGFFSLVKPNSEFIQVIYILIACGSIALFIAVLVRPDSFVDRLAYEKGKAIPWVYPHSIDSRLTYVRAIFAIVTILIGFL
jgi:hypothetical protein